MLAPSPEGERAGGVEWGAGAGALLVGALFGSSPVPLREGPGVRVSVLFPLDGEGWDGSGPCDICPLRGRPCVGYAGSMPVALTLPIDRTYSSPSQLSMKPMGPRTNSKISEILSALVPRTIWKQATAMEMGQTKETKISSQEAGPLVTRGTRVHFQGPVGILVSRWARVWHP